MEFQGHWMHSAMWAFCAALLCPHPLVAQEDRRGITAGAFTLSPGAVASISYNDNIFEQETDKTDSLILRLAPSVEVKSNWSRHELLLRGSAELGRFLSSSADNYLDGALGFRGTLDATRATRLRLEVDVSREHEARGTDDAPLTLPDPLRLARVGAKVTGQYDPGRLRVQPYLALEHLDFEPIQNDRDRNSITVGALVGWRYSPKTEIFAEGALRLTDFEDAIDSDGLDRDNTSLRLLVGVDWEMSRLVEWRLAAGFESRRYDDDSLKGFSGPIAEGRVTWKPRREIQISATARRQIEETTVAPASGTDVSSGLIDARWGIQRFVAITANAGFERRDFRGANRVDRTFSFGLGTEWRFRRGAMLSAGYRHIRERSDVAGEDHTSNVLSLSLGYRF